MPATLPAAGYMSNNARTEGEQKQAFEDILAAIRLGFRADCRLVHTNATTITLQRHDGKSVPFLDAGGNLYFLQLASEPTLANTGLAANTTYYIYAYDNAGAVALEASTTAHAAHASGLRTKSGDITRTLVGMIRTEGSTPGQFVDSETKRFTRSWFNRKAIRLRGKITATRTTTSTTYVQIHSEVQVDVLHWAGEVFVVGISGTIQASTTAMNVDTALGVDSTTAAYYTVSSYDSRSVADDDMTLGITEVYIAASDNNVFFNIIGKVSSGTGTWKPDTSLAAALIPLA